MLLIFFEVAFNVAKKPELSNFKGFLWYLRSNFARKIQIIDFICLMAVII